jgi:hypothetical protein
MTAFHPKQKGHGDSTARQTIINEGAAILEMPRMTIPFLDISILL